MIDIEKFICSLLADHPEGVIVRTDIHKALKDQGLEYKNGKIVSTFDANIQEGDNIVYNKDFGCRVNLSQLNRVAKREPKFKVGDWIIFNGITLYIKEVVKGYYRTISKSGLASSYDWDIDNVARLWTIQDAKDGDVLADN